MKQVIIYCCIVVLLVAGCLNAEESAFENVVIHEAVTTPMTNDSVWSYSEYNSNGLSVDVTNHHQRNMSIQIRRGSELLNLDLGKLQIPWKTPSVDWVKDDFMCITNWWSGPFRKCIFILLEDKLENYIYLDKDIQLTDSVTNSIIYIDTLINQTTEIVVVENLKTRKRTKVELLEASYDSLVLNDTFLEIWRKGRQRTVNLNEY